MWNSLPRVVPSWALNVPKDGDSHPCLGHCSHDGTSSWWESYLYLTRIPLTGITAFTSNPFAVHLGDESGFSFFFNLQWVSEERNKTTSTSPPDWGTLTLPAMCSHLGGSSLHSLQSPESLLYWADWSQLFRCNITSLNWARKLKRVERTIIKKFHAHILAQVSLTEQLSCTCYSKVLSLSSQCHHLSRAAGSKGRVGMNFAKVPGNRILFSESRISLNNWHWRGKKRFHTVKAMHLIKTRMLEWIF